ncbi:aromatic ring-hydroxylating dioxygenase subunit alpha [Marinobacterium sp. D7]|uniref:aromatic ring-hydroxylating dioxygenase subunit alpha n=1 Tax=Marinobacterium ramblicola TaxID=2849041 RepID=UPI001C2D14EF|nr:aromatic ring-hydroxylating dioxygenase subunit alpha [Marinobacterium ramblicola]MBV1790407.1 aromatic ring-hydroxylating dioxygenase subunit alpha [Marinobacterium ramblicola]
MSLTRVQRAAQVACRRMADRKTPFIYNEWYVAALTREVSRELMSRTILDQQVLLFRKEDGTPVALNNRCGHRSFPLSRSTLDGDTVVCGYHGLRYNEKGECVEVPSQCNCSGISIRSYPVHQQGPVIWIWMGEAEQADLEKIPAMPMLEEGWVTSEDYMDLKCSYVYLHENLLDLTHLSFLHANTFGTPDYARANFDTDISEDRFLLKRYVVPTRLPPVWAKPTGLEDKDAARITTSDFVSPALHIVHAEFYDISLDESERPDQRIKTAHIPTPATADRTHYFVVHGRNFALEEDEVTDFMHQQLMAAFQEDVVGLQAVSEMIEEYGDSDDYYEISVKADAASVAMRRYLKRRAEAELAEREATAGMKNTPTQLTPV